MFLGGFFRIVCPYLWLIFKSGFYSRADYDGAHTVCIYAVKSITIPLYLFLNDLITHDVASGVT